MKILKVILFVTILITLLAVPSIKADQQIRTIEYPINYIAETKPNVPYMQEINLISPDGISEILSFEIELYGDYNKRIIVEGLIEDKKKLYSCTPLRWTTPDVAFSYLTTFDCTRQILDSRVSETSFNSMNPKDSFNSKFTKSAIGFRTSESATNLYGNIKITYLTESKISMDVFGTDYFPNDNGTIFLQLIDDNGYAITNGSCYINGWYPNKSSYLSNVLMNYLSEGLFYYDFVIPSTIGIYMLSASCYLPGDNWIDDFINYSKIESYENLTISNNKLVLTSEPIALPANINMTENVLLMHLNEKSGTIIDSSSEGNNGTYNGVLYNQTGKINTSIGFNGITNVITINDDPSLNINTPYSISGWIKPNKVSGFNTIISKGNTVWEMVVVVNNGQLGVGFENCADDNFLGFGGTISIGKWQHVTYIYNGSRVLGYIDGIEVINVDGSGTPCLKGLPLGIGYTLNGNIFPFNGSIDEVAIWNRALSPEEVIDVYNLGIGNKLRGYVYSELITLNGNVWKTFGSDYDLKDGTINFSILDSNNNTLCSNLGDIESCANNTSPIKLYAELSRTDINLTTPDLDRWYVNWTIEQIQEIKGAGELNVKDWSRAETIWSYSGTIGVNIINQIVLGIWNYTGDITSNILGKFSNETWNATARYTHGEIV